MGFLNKFFGKPAEVQDLPTGTITVNRHGAIVTSTVASAYSQKLLLEVGRDVLEIFRSAHEAQIPLAELRLNYGSLHITARELRGGAIIFLFPQTALMPTPTHSLS
jgi:hypothetical protein